MTATVKAVHPEEGGFDPATNQNAEVEVIDWAGPAHIRPASRASRYVDVAQQNVALTVYEVWLPADTDLGAGKTLVVTESYGDSALIGVKLAITTSHLDDWQTALRLFCETAT